VIYGRFRSVSDAGKQVEDWLHHMQEVSATEQKKDSQGQLIGEVIYAKEKNTETQKDDFVVLKRNGLSCYKVRASSLSFAKEIENLIEPD
jgi:hypothetical protein